MAANRGSWWLDLVVVGLAATVPAALVYAGVEQTWLRLAAGVPLVLFLPGYALVSAMFPEAREDADPPFTRETGEGIDRAMRTRVRGLTGIDRVGVAVPLSAALSPGVALVHYVASGQFATFELAAGLGVLTWAFVFMGLARRLRLPAAHRFGASPGWLDAAYERYFVPSSPHMSAGAPFEASDVADVALNVVLVCSLLIALTTATYAFTQPPTDQRYDELAVLTQNDDGDYVAGGYPEDLSGSETLYVSVTNQRDFTREYVLRATLEVVNEDGEVVASDEQATRSFELAPGERTVVEHDPEPTLDGQRLRIRYTLEFAGADGDPDRSVHVWISGGGEGDATQDQQRTPTPEESGDTGTPEPTPTATQDGQGSPTPTPTPTPSPTPTPTPTETDDGIFG
jgi:uncharacterized membrane protein